MNARSVCFLGYELHPPWTEGTKVLTRDFMRTLDDAGATVSAVSTIGPADRPSGEYDTRYARQTAAARVAGRLGYSPTTADLPMLAQLAVTLRRQVARYDADVVHAGFASHTLFSAVCSIPPRVPFVAQTFGRVENQAWLERLGTTRRVDAYVTCSVGDVERLHGLDLPRERVHRVPPRVAVTHGSAARGRDLLGLDPASFAVGYIGHVKPERLPRAYLERLDSFAADDDTEAVVLTKERAGRRFDDYENVSLIERTLSPEEKADAFAAVDVWAFPFDFAEPSRPPVIDPPLTVLEAMGAGRPVVASELLSIPAYVEDGKTGLLHPPGDHGTAVDRLEVLRAGDVDAAAIGRAARRHVASSFGSERVSAALAAVYASVLGE